MPKSPEGSATTSVDVVIPHFGPDNLVLGAVAAVVDQQLSANRIIVVDDATPGGGTVRLRGMYPKVEVFTNAENVGFVGTAMRGVRESQADFVALLNNDAVPDSSWLQAALSHLCCPQNADVLGVTTLMISGSGFIDVAGLGVSARSGPQPLLRGRRAALAGACRTVTAMCGGAVVLRRRPFQALGGFDSRFVAYHEDVDVSLRAAVAGWRWLLCTEAQVAHMGGRTFSHGSCRHLALSTLNEARVIARYWPPKMETWSQLALVMHLARTVGSLAIKHRQPRVITHVAQALWRERRTLKSERRAVFECDGAEDVLVEAWR